MNHFVEPPDAPHAAAGSPDGPAATATTAQPAPAKLAGMAERVKAGIGMGRKQSSVPPPHQGAQWQSATPPRHATSTAGSDVTRLVLLVVLLLVALGGVGMATGVLQLGTPEDVGVGAKGDSGAGGVGGDTWSYYHDRNYDTDTTGPKWSTDRTRSTDPNAAVLGDTSRWEYDGAYQYGPYGQDGMSRRAAGRETADPLYSSTDPLPDVFAEYGGTLDPAGDQTVGAPPSNFTNPYFDPYAGYSNPYANRLRLAYGEGYDTGATPAP